jgi:hypothetical protein
MEKTCRKYEKLVELAGTLGLNLKKNNNTFFPFDLAFGDTKLKARKLLQMFSLQNILILYSYNFNKLSA